MNLLEKYNAVRQQTLAFCSHLAVEDFSIQVAKFASPAKWHLAHTTWFFETFILKKQINQYPEFNENYNFLFNSYYNNVGDRILQANRGNLSRPSIQEIYAYRKHVDTHMQQLLNTDLNLDLKKLIVLGLQHEEQHQELLVTDVKYMLGHNPIFPAYHPNTNLSKDTNLCTNLIKINQGIYKIGHQGTDFCFDNELGVHQVFIDDFHIQNYLVTNGDFLEFMKDGAYQNFNLWLDDGWHWIQKNNINAPLYWHFYKGEWHQYTFAGLCKVDPNAILCHVSYYEAVAFAEWKKMRLPTEFEWEVASKQLNWGTRWEWTQSAYLPYPNFKKESGAVGEYNGKFMSNKMVLRGASAATSKNHSRTTYRNFFHPSERWQFTGIRLAK
ncbi:ergothioneine biosynthesis protein EgtB [Ochrovirga pacifica]|uniref:ergothioneine biosynthesis protein EgtB n=1 Tax=Ochrovirga pacifica TaxID=1042376 RepID=UPI000255836B|nr:ergothioneine biosynthesis protein EgtB [Ochrovirga pacifica]